MKYTQRIELQAMVHDYIANNGHMVREEDFTDFELVYNEETDTFAVQLNFEEPDEEV